MQEDELSTYHEKLKKLSDELNMLLVENSKRLPGYDNSESEFIKNMITLLSYGTAKIIIAVSFSRKESKEETLNEYHEILKAAVNLFEYLPGEYH